MSLTGSLTVVTTGTEFQVNANGVKFGNVIGDAHSITGSVSISGSATFSGNVRLNAPSSGTNKLIFGLASTDYYWLEYNDATGNIGYSSKYSHIFYGGGAGTTTILTLANNGAATFSSSVSATTGTFSGKISANTSNGIFSNFGGTSIGLTAGNYTGISLGYSENTTYTKTAIVQEQINDANTRGHLHFLVDTSADGNNAVLGDSKMMINGLTGNVGIGGDPDNTLTVFSANITTGSAPGNIMVYTTNGYGADIGGSIGLGGYYNATTGKIAFASIHGKKENGTISNAQGYMSFVVRNNTNGSTEYMRLTGNGQLFFTRSSGSTDVINIEAYSGFSGRGILLNMDGQGDAITIGGGGGSQNAINVTNSSKKVIISNLGGSGNRAVYSDASGTLTNSSSDGTLKTNVNPILYGLNSVLKLNPISFNWKDTEKFGTQREIGFLAQEVQEIVPEVVSVSEDTGILGIGYGALVGLLVEAIKEQQSQIDELKKRIG
jgi:hypothetical protein